MSPAHCCRSAADGSPGGYDAGVTKCGLEPDRLARHLAGMKIHISRAQFGRGPSGPQLDMTPDGQFVEPPAETASEKLLRYGVVVAVLTGLVVFSALALWVALALIPVAIGAGLVAYAAFRWRMWRLSRSAGGGLRPQAGSRFAE